MTLPVLFGLLGGLLILAFLANRLFSRTRVPDVLVLMSMGLLIGPVFRLVQAEQLHDLTEAFGTLAIILILFEGGLELNLRDTLQHFPGGLVLAVLAFLLSLALVAVVLWWSLQLPWTSAALVGAVLGCTSSSIVLPVLQQMKLREPVRVMLLLEASLGDVLAVLTVKVLLDTASGGGSILGTLVGGFLTKTIISLVLALLAGLLWSRLLPVLSEQRFWNVLTLAFVLLLYAAAELAHASGLIAVLGFGLALSNLRGVDRRLLDATLGADASSPEHHHKILTFHSELAFLVRTFFFVLLGLVVEFGGLRGYLLPAAGTLAALFVARWLAVKSSGWSWGAIEPVEKEIILWIMPRGLITAVLAIQVFEQLGHEFSFLPALTFAVILVTNLTVVYGSIRAARAAAAAAAPAAAEPGS